MMLLSFFSPHSSCSSCCHSDEKRKLLPKCFGITSLHVIASRIRLLRNTSKKDLFEVKSPFRSDWQVSKFDNRKLFTFFRYVICMFLLLHKAGACLYFHRFTSKCHILFCAFETSFQHLSGLLSFPSWLKAYFKVYPILLLLNSFLHNIVKKGVWPENLYFNLIH